MSKSRPGLRSAATAAEEEVALSERAFQFLREGILTGNIRPGTVLSEARVAHELGMSRTPIREALVRLASDGFVQRFLGRGVIVQELGLQEMLEVFEIQACLEAYAIQRIITAGLAVDVPALNGLLGRQRQAVERGDTRRFLEADRAMHLHILNHLENARLSQIMETAADRMIYAGYRALRSEARLRETVQEHEAIVRALAMGDLQGALAASHAHIEGAKRRLLG